MVILDTNIIIDHLRTDPNERQSHLIHIQQADLRQELALSTLSIQELYEGRSSKAREKEEALLQTIASLRIISYTYDIAKRAGEIARDIARPIEFVDASLAATAIIEGVPLFTLNKKDFVNIPNLQFYSFSADKF